MISSDNKGVITAKKAGSAIVTLTSNDTGKSISCTINVKEDQCKINYHKDINYGADLKETLIESGNSAVLYKISELGYDRDGYIFKGWRICRTSDHKWLPEDQNGVESWEEITEGIIPIGKSYEF